MNDAAMPPPLLEARKISKRFGGVHALEEVDFRLYPGEVVALAGDNGAGKSTLTKIISGVFPPDSGELAFRGEEVALANPQDARARGIETIYQDLALCDNLDVVANLFLGRERRGGFAALDEISMEKTAKGALDQLQIIIPSVRSTVAQLSGGQRQSIAVAKAVLWAPKVVILDEPTAALGVAQQRQVLDLIKRLREAGLAVVVITHNVVDVFAVADVAIVMRLGKRVAKLRVADVTPEDIVAAITGAREFAEAVAS